MDESSNCPPTEVAPEEFLPEVNTYYPVHAAETVEGSSKEHPHEVAAALSQQLLARELEMQYMTPSLQLQHRQAQQNEDALSQTVSK